MKKLTRDFYNQDSILVAKQLLGKTLAHVMGKDKIHCQITDVEAYTGIEDRACHSFGGRRTNRTEILWGEAGHAYIYLIYGMYYMLNVVAEREGNPCAVLIRGVKPMEPLDTMSQFRYHKPYSQLTKSQINNMANGPGKVCKALNLNKGHNGLDLLGDQLYIIDAPPVDEGLIHVGKRINIDYAEEAKDFLYRFYLN
ncbi:MAG: DNA-3-methyladenine glycosylase [Firmicutes bacterium HGW-Firmicutes-1]|jgi:DNA-3-methyladenine glycosylase|nr:MAG: DNA-3-methyladenine glycosylase [Firmicutes bacterium HGW-Firmicutes-1]